MLQEVPSPTVLLGIGGIRSPSRVFPQAHSYSFIHSTSILSRAGSGPDAVPRDLADTPLSRKDTVCPPRNQGFSAG